jgi:hypothetical protein
MIPKVFFNIPYPSRFSGYLGYQKSGINIALFIQVSYLTDLSLHTMDCTTPFPCTVSCASGYCNLSLISFLGLQPLFFDRVENISFLRST